MLAKVESIDIGKFEYDQKWKTDHGRGARIMWELILSLRKHGTDEMKIGILALNSDSTNQVTQKALDASAKLEWKNIRYVYSKCFNAFCSKNMKCNNSPWSSKNVYRIRRLTDTLFSEF